MSFVVNAVKSVGNAISNVVSGVVHAVGSVVSGVVSAVGSVVSSVLNFVISPFLGLFGFNAPDIPDQTQAISGVTVQKEGSDINIPVVYGFRKVGGVVTFCETGSDNNKYLWVAYVLSEGPIEGVRDIYINDIPVGAGNIPVINQQVQVSLTDTASDKLINRTQLFLSKGNGTTVGAAIKSSIFAGSPSFTTDMNYNGLAVMFARYEWINSTDQKTADANPFSGSIPKLQCTILGRKITSLTSGSPENYNYNVQSGSYSTNPAEIILDYLRNPQYGKGLKNDDIDWPSFKTAASKFNQTVTYTASGVSGPIQTLNCVVDTGQSLFTNTKLLLQNCRSYLPYSRRGTYMLIVEDAGNPTDILSGSAPIVATFTKDNIQGPITYTGIERTSKYNQVAVTYCDPDQQWTAQTVFVPDTTSAEHATYLAEDGQRYNKGDFTFAWVTNFAMAYDMGRLILQKSRWQDTISLTVTSQGLELMVGDSIYVDSIILKFGTDPNANAIPWRIVSTKVNNDYSVTLGCVRNINELYPYVKTTDRDYKLAVWVPKGATRYYPPEPVGIPIGLKPPTSAPIDPTDPNNPTDPGKGIGGSGPLTDILIIFKTDVITENNSYYINLTFNKPDNSGLISALFSWNALPNGNPQTVEKFFGNNISPNADGSYTVRIGPLIANTYFVTSRLKYSTNDLSVRYTTNTITCGTTTGGTGTGGTGTGPSPTQPVNLSDDYFSYITGNTIVGTDNLPLPTRKIAISITQYIGSGTNIYLSSVQIYYKPSLNTKWFLKEFPVNVTPGTPVTVQLEVGRRLYPLIQSGNPDGVPYGSDFYDFVFRYAYNDGTTSKWQARTTNVRMEDNGLSYNFAIFGGGVILKEPSTPLILASLTDVVETRNITISSYSIRTIVNDSSSLRMFIYAPVLSDRLNWYGVRVYRHKAGVSGSGDYVDIIPATFVVLTNEWNIVVPGITYDETWEFVVVPLVYLGEGTVEAFNGQYLSGYLHNRQGDADYPSNSNWIYLWQVGQVEPLATARARIGTAVPKAFRNDTYFSQVTANTLTNSGVPFTTRKISFAIRTSIANGGANGHVSKVRIYYKLNSNLYWKYTEYPISAENTIVTFDSTQTTPAMDLGVRQYPNNPFQADNYDFYFRIVYTDKTMSKFTTYQLNVNTEYDGSSYGFTLFNNTTSSYANWVNLDLEENAPPGTFTNPLDLTIRPISISATGTGTTGGTLVAKFYEVEDPMKPYFAGLRIYRRDLTYGVDNTYSVNDTNQPWGKYYNEVGFGYARIDTTWDTRYAYMFTPLVWYQGKLQETTNSLYWEGAMHNRITENTGLNPYPGAVTGLDYGNWLSKRSAITINTATEKSLLTQPIVVDNLVVKITKMSLYDNANGDYRRRYHQISYIKPTGADSVTVYRRSASYFSVADPDSPTGRRWVYYQAKNYYGAGRWERMDINDSGAANGTTVTINLRDAIDTQEFNTFYDPTLAQGITSLVDPPSKNTVHFAAKFGTYTAGKDIPPTTGFKLNQSIGGSQFLFVVNYTENGVSKVSTQGLLLIGAYDNVSGVFGDFISNGNVIANSNIVTMADLENIVTVPASTNGVSLLRKLSEARSPIATSNIQDPRAGYYTVGGWSFISVTPTII